MRTLTLTLCAMVLAEAVWAGIPSRIDPLGTLGAATTAAWTPASLSPVAWYKLDGNAIDSSTYANHGTLVNSPTNVVDRTGVLGGALGFGGTKRITIPDAAQLNVTGEVTIATWVLLQSTINGWVLAKNTDSWPSVQYGLFVESVAGGVQFHLNGAARATATVPGSVWKHIVCVRNNSGSVAIYINSALAASASYTNALINAPNMNIGARSAAVDNSSSIFPFTGYIDDVMIFNRALTTNEIKQLYNWRP